MFDDMDGFDAPDSMLASNCRLVHDTVEFARHLLRGGVRTTVVGVSFSIGFHPQQLRLSRHMNRVPGCFLSNKDTGCGVSGVSPSLCC